VRRERVPGQAERADPDLAADVDLAARTPWMRWSADRFGGRSSPVWVQDGAARRLAGHRLVQDRREILADLERHVERRDGHDRLRRLDARGRPDVPAQAHACARPDQNPHSETRAPEHRPSRSSTSSKLIMIACSGVGSADVEQMGRTRRPAGCPVEEGRTWYVREADYAMMAYGHVSLDTARAPVGVFPALRRLRDITQRLTHPAIYKLASASRLAPLLSLATLD
jgi:hypothetical protein